MPDCSRLRLTAQIAFALALLGWFFAFNDADWADAGESATEPGDSYPTGDTAESLPDALAGLDEAKEWQRPDSLPATAVSVALYIEPRQLRAEFLAEWPFVEQLTLPGTETKIADSAEPVSDEVVTQVLSAYLGRNCLIKNDGIIAALEFDHVQWFERTVDGLRDLESHDQATPGATLVVGLSSAQSSLRFPRTADISWRRLDRPREETTGTEASEESNKPNEAEAPNKAEDAENEASATTEASEEEPTPTPRGRRLRRGPEAPYLAELAVRIEDPQGVTDGVLTARKKRLRWKQPEDLGAREIPTVVPVEYAVRGQVIAATTSGLALLVAVALLFPGNRDRPSLLGTSIALSALTLIGLVSFLLTARAPVIEGEEGRSVLHDLLFRVYRAQEAAMPNDIYDWLEVTTTDSIRQEIYLHTVRSQSHQKKSGARAKVEHIEVLGLQPASIPEGFAAAPTDRAVRGQWRVGGIIGHWGHVHRRLNQYEGVMVLRPTTEGWRIAHIRMLNEERVVRD